ncbi:MAG: DNA-binding protein [Actinobacteria bacterium]|nr:DNA-binding protein [Actinomycetota bacterium]
MSEAVVSAAGAIGRVVAARLTPGTDLIPAILDLARKHGIRSGIILSCVANTNHVVLRNPPASFKDGGPPAGNRSFLRVDDPAELVSLGGNISFNEDGTAVAHVHACISSAARGPEASALGGHLEEMTVMSTAEIVIGELAGIDMVHRPDPSGRAPLHPEAQE